MGIISLRHIIRKTSIHISFPNTRGEKMPISRLKRCFSILTKFRKQYPLTLNTHVCQSGCKKIQPTTTLQRNQEQGNQLACETNTRPRIESTTTNNTLPKTRTPNLQQQEQQQSLTQGPAPRLPKLFAP